MRWVSLLVAVVTTAATVVGAAPATVAAAPATASISWPLRVVKSSAHNDGQFKAAVAACPAGHVMSAGAEVVDGKGAVVLTAIEPDPGLTEVTAVAIARSGFAGDWSVVAIAICHPDAAPTGLVASGPGRPRLVSASCPVDTQLSGVGFRMLGSVDTTHLVALQPSEDLREVFARTGGPVPPVSLLAYGICQEGSFWERGEAISIIDGVWPKVVEVSVPSWCPEVVYGVGGVVNAEGGFLTALVPDLEKNRAWVRAERPPVRAAAAMALTGEEEGDGDSVQGYSIEIGTPYC